MVGGGVAEWGRKHHRRHMFTLACACVIVWLITAMERAVASADAIDAAASTAASRSACEVCLSASSCAAACRASGAEGQVPSVGVGVRAAKPAIGVGCGP